MALPQDFGMPGTHQKWCDVRRARSSVLQTWPDRHCWQQAQGQIPGAQTPSAFLPRRPHPDRTWNCAAHRQGHRSNCPAIFRNHPPRCSRLHAAVAAAGHTASCERRSRHACRRTAERSNLFFWTCSSPWRAMWAYSCALESCTTILASASGTGPEDESGILIKPRTTRARAGMLMSFNLCCGRGETSSVQPTIRLSTSLGTAHHLNN
jgi:hypothetical protein